MKRITTIIFSIIISCFYANAAQWQEIFPDKKLQALIAEALAANTDIKGAQLAMDQSEALLKSAKLSYVPGFALAPSGTLSKIADSSPMGKIYALPVVMDWEINFAGKEKAQIDMAQANMMSSEERLQYVQLQVVAALANAYCTLIMLDRQTEITSQSVENQKENLEVIKTMKSVGLQNETAVNQAEASLQSTIASLSDLQLMKEKTESAICLLLNRQASKVERSAWSEVASINFDADKSYTLEELSSRPDVKMAEYGMRASFANVKVAKASFYPSLSISATAGFTNNLGEIVNPGQFLLNAIGTLAQPLFARGALKANLKVAQAQQEQAKLDFNKALLTASTEVKDALSECRSSKAKEAARASQVMASKNAYENSKELMKYSHSTYLEVLIAQIAYLSSQLEQTADWMELQQGLINLYKATCPGIN